MPLADEAERLRWKKGLFLDVARILPPRALGRQGFCIEAGRKPQLQHFHCIGFLISQHSWRSAISVELVDNIVYDA